MAVVTETSVVSEGGLGAVQAFIGLWTWFAAVIAYAIYRSQGAARTDPIVPPGPHDGDE